MLELLRRLLLVHRGGDGMACLMHDRLDLGRAARAQDAVEIDRAEQLEGGIDDEDLREALGQVLVVAHVVDRLADRPERRHGDELRLHAPARRLLGIVQRAAQADALGEGKLRQDLVLVGLVQVFEDVDGVVRVELLHAFRDLRVGQVLDDLQADRLVHLGERGEVEVGAEQLHKLPALFRQQRFQQVADLGLMEVADLRLQHHRVAVGDRRADLQQERRADHAFRVVDAARRPRVPRLRPFVVRALHTRLRGSRRHAVPRSGSVQQQAACPGNTQQDGLLREIDARHSTMPHTRQQILHGSIQIESAVETQPHPIGSIVIAG